MEGGHRGLPLSSGDFVPQASGLVSLNQARNTALPAGRLTNEGEQQRRIGNLLLTTGSFHYLLAHLRVLDAHDCAGLNVKGAGSFQR